jgi:hypothetical protein
MRNALIPAVIGSILGFAAIGAYAEEVKLTDQDRVELRQRADSMRMGNAGRMQDSSIGRSTDSAATPMKAKHSKKHVKKHSKRTASKRHT